ncbi:MAG TPA: DegV family protein [Anaerolineae bacterium]
MTRLALITDSSCGLSADLIARYDLHALPYYILAGGRMLKDGIHISREEVFRLLRDGRHLPNTKAPTLGDFAALYRSLLGKVDAALVISPPRERTAAYQHAESARSFTPDLNIAVLDSRHTSIGQALVVLAAAHARGAGGDLKAILGAAQHAIDRMEVWVVLESLKFAARSGRVPNLDQFERAGYSPGPFELSGEETRASPPGVPVLRHENGAPHIAFTARNVDQAMERLKAGLADRVRGERVHAAITHAGDIAQAESIRAWAQSTWSPVELHVLELPPILAVYAGPGAVGVAVYNE